MYRPSDKEIAAVAQILKDWNMPAGWQTAAVLALDAAGKVRAPKKMEKCTDSEMVKFLEDVVGVVEATRTEQVSIWADSKDIMKYSWEEESFNSFLETIGYVDDRPVCISLKTVKINAHKILFWHATSQIVDYILINEWLELNTPNNRTDAINWHNVLPR